jgi:hypothetical protein
MYDKDIFSYGKLRVALRVDAEGPEKTGCVFMIQMCEQKLSRWSPARGAAKWQLA